VAVRRVLITGAANFWGTRAAAALAAVPGGFEVVGLDTRPRDPDLPAAVEYVQDDVRSSRLPGLLRGHQIDTVVHNDILQFAEPGRSSRSLHDINVIGTLSLLTACERLPSLRSIVVRGSAAIYGSEPSAPAFFTEDMARRYPLRTRFQRDIGELENLFETFARRHPAVTCTMLRYQPVIGSALDTPITALARARVVPTMLGFDPRIQLLHEDDSVDGLVAAIHRPVHGAVNVAGEGTVSLQRMLRRLGRPSLPIAAPLFATVTGAAHRLGLPPVSADTMRYLRYGRGVDITRLVEEVGFRPRYSTADAVEAVLRSVREAKGAAA
jgi:UDP-glucose 4-epimerase